MVVHEPIPLVLFDTIYDVDLFKNASIHIFCKINDRLTTLFFIFFELISIIDFGFGSLTG